MRRVAYIGEGSDDRCRDEWLQRYALLDADEVRVIAPFRDRPSVVPLYEGMTTATPGFSVEHPPPRVVVEDVLPAFTRGAVVEWVCEDARKAAEAFAAAGATCAAVSLPCTGRAVEIYVEGPWRTLWMLVEVPILDVWGPERRVLFETWDEYRHVQPGRHRWSMGD